MIFTTLSFFFMSLLSVSNTAPLMLPYYAKGIGHPMQRLQVHGDWCGISHATHKDTADPCIDELDCLCRMHRNCLDGHDNRDGFHCRCNSEILARMSDLDQQTFPEIPVLIPQFQFCILKRKSTKLCSDGDSLFSFLKLVPCNACEHELIRTPENAPADSCFPEEV